AAPAAAPLAAAAAAPLAAPAAAPLAAPAAAPLAAPAAAPLAAAAPPPAAPRPPRPARLAPRLLPRLPMSHRRRDQAERARQHPEGGRQGSRGLAVDVEPHLLARGRLGAQRAGAPVAHLVEPHVAAAVHLAAVAEELELAEVAHRHHVELAVVELGAGRDEHAAAEVAAVGDRHRVDGVVAGAGLVAVEDQPHAL